MKIGIRAGTNVTDIIATPTIAKLLVKASGWKSFAFPAAQGRRPGMNEMQHDHHGEEDGPAHRPAGADNDLGCIAGHLAVAEVFLEVVRGVLDHDDGLVHEDADGDGDPRQRHDVGLDVKNVQPPQDPDHEEREQHRQGQRDADDEDAAEVHEDEQDRQAGDEDFMQQDISSTIRWLRG